MARIRQRVIKDAVKKIVVNYWDIVKEIWDKASMIEDVNPEAAAQFRVEMYKKLVDKVTTIKSKKIRNRVAGYLITFMKQLLYLGRYSLEELATRYTIKESTQPTKSSSEMEEEKVSEELRGS